jgi:hypothetical protein
MCGNQIKIVWRSLCRAFESVSEMETGKKKKKKKVLTFGEGNFVGVGDFFCMGFFRGIVRGRIDVNSVN